MRRLKNLPLAPKCASTDLNYGDVVPRKNGRILIAGGAEQPEAYDPTSNSFLVAAGSKLDGFCFSTATLLAYGNVLLVGGYERGGGRRDQSCMAV